MAAALVPCPKRCPPAAEGRVEAELLRPRSVSGGPAQIQGPPRRWSGPLRPALADLQEQAGDEPARLVDGGRHGGYRLLAMTLDQGYFRLHVDLLGHLG